MFSIPLPLSVFFYLLGRVAHLALTTNVITPLTLVQIQGASRGFPHVATAPPSALPSGLLDCHSNHAARRGCIFARCCALCTMFNRQSPHNYRIRKFLQRNLHIWLAVCGRHPVHRNRAAAAMDGSDGEQWLAFHFAGQRRIDHCGQANSLDTFVAYGQREYDGRQEQSHALQNLKRAAVWGRWWSNVNDNRCSASSAGTIKRRQRHRYHFRGEGWRSQLD